MTELLLRALEEVGKLPADAQDAIAARFLAEAADEQAWMASFEATTGEHWDRWAEAVRRDTADGETSSADELLKRL